jgi:DNA-directed RNA polymerase subunit M
MEFCAHCGARLTPTRRREKGGDVFLLSCRRCGQEREVASSYRTNLRGSNRILREGMSLIGPEEQRLRTTPTIRKFCPRCGNNLVYAWLVQLQPLEESSTQFFRCTRCSHTFRESR